MTFLNLGLLAGLSAIGIPLLVHLVHRHRVKAVRWGAMQFLQPVSRTRPRRLRLEQLLLLLVRMSVPLLLALLMARPVWKGSRSLVGDARTSLVAVLDTSYSMDAGRSGETAFSRALASIADVAGNLKGGSPVHIVEMGEVPRLLAPQPAEELGRGTPVFPQARPESGVASVAAALQSAAAILSQSRELDQQVVVFTDFQRVSFGEDARLGSALEAIRRLPLPARVTLFDVGRPFTDNVAVESLELSKLGVGVGQKIELRAHLRNFGNASYTDLKVVLRVDGKEQDVAQLALAPERRGQVLFTHRFEKPGSHTVEVEALADSLRADNVFFASVSVSDRLPVLLVDGDPGKGPMKGEMDFAEIALQPYGSGRVDMADLISAVKIRPEDIHPDRLEKVSAVILANVANLGPSQLTALQDFVRNGGGLLVFPGDRVDSAVYNAALFQEGRGLLPFALDPPATAAAPGRTPAMSVVEQRFEDPALEIFNDPRNGRLSDASIQKWFRLREAPSPEATAARKVLARLENGDVFLAEKQWGAGRVIQCATALDADWSNLPMRPVYLPLLQRLTVYLCGSSFPARNLEPGQPMVAVFGANDVGKTLKLTHPGGIPVELPVVQQGARGVLEYSNTQKPGIYTLTLPDGDGIHFVVNASRKESDLRRLSAGEIGGLAAANGVDLVSSTEEYLQRDRALRFGRELWRPLLWGLLAVVFVELFLAQYFGGTAAGASKKSVDAFDPAFAGKPE
jgi:hypothetical protein